MKGMQQREELYNWRSIPIVAQSLVTELIDSTRSPTRQLPGRHKRGCHRDTSTTSCNIQSISGRRPITPRVCSQCACVRPATRLRIVDARPGMRGFADTNAWAEEDRQEDADDNSNVQNTARSQETHATDCTVRGAKPPPHSTFSPEAQEANSQKV